MTSAICIGVTMMSCWPKESMASAASLAGSGKREASTVSGVWNVFPNPKASACAIIFSAPTPTPPMAYAVLQDWIKV